MKATPFEEFVLRDYENVIDPLLEQVIKELNQKIVEIETDQLEEKDYEIWITHNDLEACVIFEPEVSFEHYVGGEYMGWKEEISEMSVDKIHITTFDICADGDNLEVISDVCHKELKRREKWIL